MAGAQTIFLDLLDHNFSPIPTFVSPTGLTPVVLPSGAVYMRNNGMTVIASGSNGVNVGNITLRITGGGATRGMIPANIGIMNAFQYTTPIGYTAWFDNFLFGQVKAGGTIATWEHQFRIYFPNGSFIVASEVEFGNGFVPITIPSGFAIPATNMMEVRATTVSSDGVTISVQATGILTNNTAPGVVQRLPTAFTEY